MNRFRTLALFATAAVLAPLPVLAQSVADMGLPSGAEAGDKGTADAEAKRKALNEAQAQSARAQVQDNEDRLRAREAAVATEAARQQREQATYDEAVRQHDTVVRDYEAARVKWESANPACKRNDPVKCPR